MRDTDIERDFWRISGMQTAFQDPFTCPNSDEEGARTRCWIEKKSE